MNFLNTDPPFDQSPPYPMHQQKNVLAKFVHNYDVEKVKKL